VARLCGQAGSKRFFLKKEAKTSIRWPSVARPRSQTNKSFLVLLRKKEPLALPAAEISRSA
jgi:hypothetical protein